jgi:hypothetical protein
MVGFLIICRSPMNNITPVQLYQLLCEFQAEQKLQNIYMGFQPDSITAFEKFPEYEGLWQKFIKHDDDNNIGDASRLWSLILNCRQIIEEAIPGDYAELGVWKGNTAAVLAYYAKVSEKKAYFFDTFSGFDGRDFTGVDANVEAAFEDTSIDLVSETVGKENTHCEYIKGYFPDSLQESHKDIKFSVVSIDCDLYEPIKAGLDFFYPRMSKGGILYLHDYSSGYWEGAKKAIDEFCGETGEYLILMPDKSGSAFVRKSK